METVVLEQLLMELRALLGKERVTQNDTVLEQHSRDESYHKPVLPDVVVFPKTTEEVSEIMKLATKYRTPVVPFGMGSSLEGNAIPIHGGISLDFTLMNEILEIREKDFLVKVQPGVTRKQLNRALKPYGLFFPVDPGADATIGGLVATGASGTTTVKYGTMREQVRDLEVVLADGSIIHTGSSAAKSSSGYHLNGLFVGSEGTLGCFTEITLRVYGIPEHILAARAVFDTVKDAVNAVLDVRQAGIPVARIEFVDELALKEINRYTGTDYAEKPTIFFEFHGNRAGLDEDRLLTEEIVNDHGCREFVYETDQDKRNQLWEARHHVAYAFSHNYRNRKLMVTDVCLPISELADAILFARDEVLASGLPGGIVGHVGDGNYHINLMVDVNDPEEIAKANRLNSKIVEYAIAREGTCTGEHGVGIGKKKFQELEHGAALEIMKKLKEVLDPNGILNPGKIF